MDVLKAQAAHIIMAAIAVGAVCALAVAHLITGSDAIGIIGVATGVSLGGAVGSLSPSGTAATQTLTVPVHTTLTQSPSPLPLTTTVEPVPLAVVPDQPVAASGDGATLSPSATT